MMTLYLRSHLLGALCAASLAVSWLPGSALAQEIGRNAALKGNVTIASAQQKALQAEIGKPVFLSDLVNSKRLSSLQVLLLDETVFTVGPDCELTIDRFVYDPASNNNSLKAKVKKGVFRFVSGSTARSNSNNVSIDTPVASMGIRGTMVEGIVGPEATAIARRAGVVTSGAPLDVAGASLFILRGPGAKNSGKDRRGEISVTSGGETRRLRQAGMAIFVPDKNSPPSPAFKLTDSEFEALSAKLRTTPKPGPNYRPFDVSLNLMPPRTGGRSFNTETDLETDSYDPRSDLDWPTEFNTGSPNPICNPNNPNFPSC